MNGMQTFSCVNDHMRDNIKRQSPSCALQILDQLFQINTVNILLNNKWYTGFEIGIYYANNILRCDASSQMGFFKNIVINICFESFNDQRNSQNWMRDKIGRSHCSL